MAYVWYMEENECGRLGINQSLQMQSIQNVPYLKAEERKEKREKN